VPGYEGGDTTGSVFILVFVLVVFVLVVVVIAVVVVAVVVVVVLGMIGFVNLEL
jgi:hypothetical protein